MIFPAACQRVVAVSFCWRLVLGEHFDNIHELACKGGPVLSPGFALQVTFKARGSLNCPH
jgi:hypothetical protein